MSAHSYSLRSRINSQSPSLRPSPAGSPIPRAGARPISKGTSTSTISLQLKRVIGTTTKDPNGLSCCLSTKTYAYCAGSAVVLAAIQEDGRVKHRYFRAKPSATASSSQTTSYEISAPVTPTTRRRNSIFGPKRLPEPYQDDTPGKDSSDDIVGQTWSARERIKTATCLSLSHDGAWLAVGESGYNPRVLVFSTADDSLTDTPVSIATEHGYGVRCVAFSPDSRWLATLGNHNDGYILVWSFNPKTGATKLHSSNKCTSSICDMTWCGHNLITVGTRHVKVWSVAESQGSPVTRKSRARLSFGHLTKLGPIPLHGRNCLLGALVDNIFTCVTATSTNTAVVATEQGVLCVFDVSQAVAELRVVREYPHPIGCLSYRPASRQLVVGGPQGLFYEDWSSLERSSTPFASFSPTSSFRSSKKSRPSTVRLSLGLCPSSSTGVVAVGCMEALDVVLNDDGDLELHLSGSPYQKASLPSFGSHNDAIQGLQDLPTELGWGHFYTWSRNGEINFWTADGELLRRERTDLDRIDSAGDLHENELKSMCLLQDQQTFVVGDRCGVIKTISAADWQVGRVMRAHSAEVNCIAAEPTRHLVATCGRDRVVQLFRCASGEVDLVQTMDDHVGAVTQVLFCEKGEKLLSCSADRTVIVRDWMQSVTDVMHKGVYLASRVISTKSTPLSLSFVPWKMGHIFVSTTDRHVTQIDYQSGTINDSFKVADPNTDDTVSLNTIRSSSRRVHEASSPNRLVGYSSIDKSIRIYDAEKGVLLCREFGHTEGISDLALIEHDASLQATSSFSIVTTGLDGTIMIWATLDNVTAATPTIQHTPHGLGLAGLEGCVAAKASPLSLPPLRKVLTKIELAQIPGLDSSAIPNSRRSRSRSQSPQRLHRKVSTLTLSETIDENAENIEPPQHQIGGREEVDKKITIHDSRSPPLKVESLKTRSRTETSKEGFPKSNESMVSGDKVSNDLSSTANKGRLRRPPSMPTDLRQHALDQATRRPRTAVAASKPQNKTDIKKTTETLRNFRRQFQDEKGKKPEEDLEDLEDEIVSILKIIRKQKRRTSRTSTTASGDLDTSSANDGNDGFPKDKVGDLTALMSRATLQDES